MTVRARLLAAVLAMAALAAQTRDQPRFRVETRTIPVHVVVLDREGRPVRNLSRDVFRVFEEGGGQKIDLFFEVDLGTGLRTAARAEGATRADRPATPDPGAEPGTAVSNQDENRFFLIYFDRTLDVFSRSNALHRARQAARALVDGMREKNDFAAVSWSNLVSAFTSDRRRLHTLIEAAHPRLWGTLSEADGERVTSDSLSRDAMNLGPAENPQPLGIPPARLTDPASGTRMYDSGSIFERLYGENSSFYGPPLETVFARLFESHSLSGYADTIGLMKSLKGRKIVIYLGTGLGDPTGEELSSNAYDPRLAARAFNDAGFTVFTINPYGVTASASSGLPGPAVRAAMTRSKGGRRWLAQAGSRGSQSWTRNMFLRRWAMETGGAGFFTNDMERGGRKILAETSHYYVLGYQPVNYQDDGKYRSIKVEIDLPDAEVRHRGGYFATVPATTELMARTVLGAILSPSEFSDFPLDVQARQSGTGDLEVSFSFSFGDLIMETEEYRESTGNYNKLYLQDVFVFIAVFDSSDKLLGSLEVPFHLELPHKQYNQLREQNATADRTIRIKEGSAPAVLKTVVVVGANQQIAAAATELWP